MTYRQTIFWKWRNLFTKIYRKRSLFLAALLFIFSSVSPAIAKIASPIPIVQSQQDAGQLTKEATQLYRSGQFQKAAVAWERTAAIFAAKGDGLNQAMALSNLSLTYQQIGEWDKATRAIEESLKLLQTQQGKDKLKIQAQTLDIQGYLQRELGRSTDALKTWQEATKIYNQVGEREKWAQSIINQVQAMQDLGLYPRACNTLLQVLNKAIDARDCESLDRITLEDLQKKLQNFSSSESPNLVTVVALRSFGNLRGLEGQLEQSEIILEASKNLAEKLNSPQEQAATYLSLGNAARDLAKVKQARGEIASYEQKALNSYNKVVSLSPLPLIRQQAELNQLSLLMKLERWEEAEELWRLLSPQLDNLSPSRTGVYLQVNFAQNIIELAEDNNFQLKTRSQLPTLSDVNRVLIKAIEQAERLGDRRAKAYALGTQGRLYTDKTMQNLPQAEKLTRQALSLDSSFNAPDIAYQHFRQLGKIQKAQGNIPEAIAAYTNAYDALQLLRKDLVTINPEVQFSFQKSVEPVYRELVDLNIGYANTLKANGKNEESQKLIIQARKVIESLQLAELNNFFKEACVEDKSKQIDNIDKKAGVIYTIVADKNLTVILSLPEQQNLIFQTTSFEPNEFRKTLDEVQRSLIDPVSVEETSRIQYQKLYNWLIKPIESELNKSQVTTLAFVLDGDLRNIPMSVLFDGKQYLIQKYAIAVTPGLQLVDPKPISKVDLRAFTAGLSKIRKQFEPHRDFKELSNVENELQQIKKLGISQRLVLNEEFTSTKLKNQILASRVPPIVHLATHGEFSSSPEKTFILSWDSRINVNQLGQLLQNTSLYQNRPIELLVLSACKTASGDRRATLGLAGVAVRAGARSTLATLWSVVDETTATIMSEFYTQLEEAKKTNQNKAEALRRSQLNIIEKYKQYRHPHYWAPFILVGNWQ
jgi:CHAT domain-containing protein